MTALPDIKDNDSWLTMDSIVSSRVHFRCQDLPTVLQVSLNPGSYVSQTFITEMRFLFHSGVFGSFFSHKNYTRAGFFCKRMTVGNSLNVRQVQPVYTCMDALPCEI